MIALRGLHVRPIALAAFALALLGALASHAMTPRQRMADARNHDLEHLIPARFAGWTQVPMHNIVVPDPARQRLENKLYSATLTRVYQNAKGEAVMLVVAYGSDQSDALQLHRPEVCYAASGYDVGPVRRDDVWLGGHELRITRVPTRDANGREPVSYWMRVGNRVVGGTLDRQLAKLSLGLAGVIPDGVLVRVSTREASAEPAKAYAMEDAFIGALLSSLDAPTRALLLGNAQ
jgi:EpsI family protein